ncbi:MAG: hypothetical protein DMD91_24225 [Candidatus Rokuibacteriota bacterium]|nr:MAG: hypothetical protein DMD91_24225 [Candidatus Rokubacteria bacterium]
MRAAALLIIVVAHVVSGVFMAWVMTSEDYEAEYLVLGSLATQGKLGLYQDEVTGQWAPLPFYVYGATQVLAGPRLFLPRLLSVVFGAVAVILAFAVARRWGGDAAGAAAAALCVANGLVSGYFALVGFASLAAVVHLAGIWLLFCTEWRHRDLAAMMIFSLLFLVKPNYWPSVPFALAYLMWRAPSWRRRAGLVAIAVALPVVFFAADPTHLKLLAYVPVLHRLVEPLGYHAWFSLLEDAAEFGSRSEYFDASWGTTTSGRLAQLGRSLVFFGKRYALWLMLFAMLAAWALRQRAARARSPGLAFVAALFWYSVACQFVVLGPWSKQAVGYAGAVAPLLAVVIAVLLAKVVASPAEPTWRRRAVIATFVTVILASPWVHRHHNLPRRSVLPDATIPELSRTADQLAARIPAGEDRVFCLADPLPLYLAGRRAYVRQMHQHRWMFTSLADTDRYRRSGLWGRAELEQWLGADARYAVVETEVVDYYRRRAPFRPLIARMMALLSDRFTIVGRFERQPGDWITVYRRRA